MVAFSFKSRFVIPIELRTKQQTIRTVRKRNARAGDGLQLMTDPGVEGATLSDVDVYGMGSLVRQVNLDVGVAGDRAGRGGEDVNPCATNDRYVNRDESCRGSAGLADGGTETGVKRAVARVLSRREFHIGAVKADSGENLFTGGNRRALVEVSADAYDTGRAFGECDSTNRLLGG